MDDGPDIELMYGLQGQHWGQGLATEACAAALERRATSYRQVYCTNRFAQLPIRSGHATAGHDASVDYRNYDHLPAIISDLTTSALTSGFSRLSPECSWHCSWGWVPSTKYSV